MKRIDIPAGTTFGDWKTLGPWQHNRHGTRCYLCRCICGHERFVVNTALWKSLSGGCGCRQYIKSSKALRKHGHVSHHRGKRLASPEYAAWQNAKARCYNPKNKDFSNYGGRGIAMSDEWRQNFQQFLTDMGPRPSTTHSLDRFPDHNGPYAAGNCRWTTLSNQINNRRCTTSLTYNGQTHTVAEWAHILAMKPNTLSMRIYRGWSPDRIFAPLSHAKLPSQNRT